MTLLAAEVPAREAADADVRCAHCDTAVPRGLIEPDAERQFCCAGCRAVFETLHSCGLDIYYRLREAAEVTPRPAKLSESGFDSFDSPTFADLYVRRCADGSACAEFVLEGVSCAACVWLVERLPRVLEGVIEARLSLREASVRVTWDPQRVALSRVARALDRLGYTPHPARGTSAKQLHQRETRRRLIHLGVAGAIMGNTMLLALALYAGDASGHMEPQYRALFRWLSVGLGVISLAWPGATFFRSAWAACRARAINLDVPIVLALLAGGVAGVINVVGGRGEIYFDSLTVLVFLLLVGRFIQYRQQRRADDSVGLLFSLTPASCRVVVRDDQVTEIPIEALAVADLVEVRAADLFPADGVVVAGCSTVNESLLTGESMPVAVETGSAVHAGSQNVASTLRVRVSKVGRDTRVGQLMDLIERGVREKPPIVQFTDKTGSWFLLAVTLASIATFIVWWRVGGLTPAIDHTVALLIVTCPCVLGLATPMTLAIAIGKLARRDILVKSGAAIEKLSRRSGGELLLDKTGTITQGRLRLLAWIGDESVKPFVAAVEAKSNHPVGRALHDALAASAASAAAEPSARGAASEVAEKGDGGLTGQVDGHALIVGSPRFLAHHEVSLTDALRRAVIDSEMHGATAVVVAVDGVAVAVASLGDEVRHDSAYAIGALRRLRWRPAILSGDAPDVVASVARAVEIVDATGGLAPEEKLRRVEQRAAAGPAGALATMTVMVGDGVNDAAALAAADVGIAVHGGAEASLAAADVYIARPGLAPLVELFQTSQLAMRTIRRNLAVSLAYNLLAGALAAAGVMTPLIAAIIMPLSSATVMSLAVASIGRTNRATALAPQGGRSWK
jgi:Cu2+-exporting ATPase